MTTRPARTSPWALRRWPGHLLVAVLLGTAVWLGSWQLGTWQGKRDAAARDVTRAEPVAVATLLGPDEAFPADVVGRPAVAEGQWLSDATVFVERGGGFWVVTPLLTDGSDGAVALPVVRGVSDTPDAPAVTGTASVTGWLQPPEGTGAVDDDPTDDVLPQLRPADLVQRVDEDLYGAYAVATEPTAGLARADLAELPESSRFTGFRNFLYALEWWVFGAFAVFVWVKYLRDSAHDTGE